MKKWILYCTLGIVGSFLLTPGALALADGAGFGAWRRQIILLTGLGGFACMAAALLLATRHPRVEQAIRGLDKAYRLHKWLGIGGAALLLLHWLAEKGPRWLGEWGFALGGGHGHGPGGHGPNGHSPWMFLAKELGEWGFYALIVLAAVALIPRIPYRFFRLVHKAMAVVFLVGAYHSLMLMPGQWLLSPAGYLTIAAALGGGAAALWSLAGKIGLTRRHGGQIEAIKVWPNGIVDIQIRLAGSGMPSAAGQFTFITFDKTEGAHPFSIASTQEKGCLLRFVIKPLGDYTRTLAARLRCGQPVEVEGPYGHFNFSPTTGQEIWVAGGIGVTPFLARLEALAEQGGSARPIHFWYCTQTRKDAQFPDNLERLCQRAGVTLHRHIAEEGQILSAATVGQHLERPQNAAVWFCGPTRFAHALRSGLQRLGVPAAQFHSEYFAMR